MNPAIPSCYLAGLQVAIMWDAADAERDVERQRSRRDDRDVPLAGLAEPHDRALAVLFLDLVQHAVQDFRLAHEYFSFF